MKKHRRYIPALVLTLISVALLTVAAIIVINGLMPKGTTAATPNFTDWISAVGQAVGAVGTAGALGLGAYTYFRQVRDQRRAQASGVTFTMTKEENWKSWACYIRNDSQLPIFDVVLLGVDVDGKDVPESRVELPAMPSRDVRGAYYILKTAQKSSTYVAFKDAAGKKWKRFGDGDFKEVKEYAVLNHE